jgi:uncharacterized membrane protein
LGAEVVEIGVNPNGSNINAGCGSTDTRLLKQTVLERRADIGIALDGDADRIIIIDEKGREIDGDQIIAAIARDMIADLQRSFEPDADDKPARSSTRTILIAALAATWLGERVSPRRWIVIAVGFAGVLLVIQPGVDGFNGWAWLCLASTVVTALRDLITRRVPPDVSSITVTLSTSMAVTLMALVVMLFEGWKPIALREGLLLAGAAAFLALGYQFIIQSTRSGDISAVAPFRYVGLLMAVALGWAVWGFVPNAMAWAGIALLIGAGLELLRQR